MTRALIPPQTTLVSLPRCGAGDTLDVAVLHQLAAASHADIEIGDLLAQCIAIDAQKVGAFRLISAVASSAISIRGISTSRNMR